MTSSIFVANSTLATMAKTRSQNQCNQRLVKFLRQAGVKLNFMPWEPSVKGLWHC